VKEKLTAKCPQPANNFYRSLHMVCGLTE
jgi:hypothetical protein